MNKFSTQLVREQIQAPYNAIIDKTTDSSDAAYALLKLLKADLRPSESMWTIHLNTVGKCIGIEEVSKGSLAQTSAGARDIFRGAILSNAASIIVAHNHPSGDVTPSDLDKKATRNLINSGDILGIRVLDHIVFSDEKYYSFASNGLMEV